jgi:hypothetical protein
MRDFIRYLGWVGFRQPVPAYKHSAAISLKLTGGLDSDEPHPQASWREDWDRALLADTAGVLSESGRQPSLRPVREPRPLRRGTTRELNLDQRSSARAMSTRLWPRGGERWPSTARTTGSTHRSNARAARGEMVLCSNTRAARNHAIEPGRLA